MGDRGNVAIFTSKDQPPVVLYTHWSGYEIPDQLAFAIERAKGRWDDESYCARIILHSLLVTLGADPESETGFGITVGELTDNEYPILVVDIPTKTVSTVTEKQAYAHVWSDDTRPSIPFADVTSAGLRELRGDS